MQNFTDKNKTALQIVFIMSEKRRNIGQLDHNDGGSPLKVNKKKNSSSAVQGGPINDNDQINRSNPDTNKSGLPLKVNQKELPVRVRASCKLDDPIDCVSAYKSCSNDKTATVADSKTFSFVEANRPVLSDTNLPSASFRKSDGIAECVAHLPPELLRKIKTFFFHMTNQIQIQMTKDVEKMNYSGFLFQLQILRPTGLFHLLLVFHLHTPKEVMGLLNV